MNGERSVEMNSVLRFLETKAKSGFSGEISVFFSGGAVTFLEKTQIMNSQRITREIKRDTNAMNRGK